MCCDTILMMWIVVPNFGSPLFFYIFQKKKKTNIKNLEEVENEPIIKYHRQK
jgi:hypothetical protein